MDNHYESYGYTIDEPHGVVYNYRHPWREPHPNKTHAVLQIKDGVFNAVLSTHKRIDLAEKAVTKYGRETDDVSLDFIVVKMTREARDRTYFTPDNNYGSPDKIVEMDTSDWTNEMWEVLRIVWYTRFDTAKHFNDKTHNFITKNRWEGSKLVSHPDLCDFCSLRPIELNLVLTSV